MHSIKGEVVAPANEVITAMCVSNVEDMNFVFCSVNKQNGNSGILITVECSKLES